MRRTATTSLESFYGTPAGETAMSDEIDDAFLELEIRSAGIRLTLAMDAGNKPEARKWEQEQRRLIGMRSPEQIARMEAAIELAIKGKQ